MRIVRLATLGVAMLAGCATGPYVPYQQRLERLHAVVPCCATTKDLPISASLEDELRVSLEETSPVFEFATGRSPFFGFRLPEISEAYALELRTSGGDPIDMRTLAIPGAKRVPGASPEADEEPFDVKYHMGHRFLYPAVLFLDETRQPISVGEDTHMSAPAGTLGLVAKVGVPRGARFAVLHTPASKVGQTYEASDVAYTCQYLVYAVICGNQQYTRRALFGPIGDIKVVLKKPSNAARKP